jgi:hypothetical protein
MCANLATSIDSGKVTLKQFFYFPLAAILLVQDQAIGIQNWFSLSTIIEQSIQDSYVFSFFNNEDYYKFIIKGQPSSEDHQNFTKM